MAQTAFRSEDKIGLAAAIVLHILLVVALVMGARHELDAYRRAEK